MRTGENLVRSLFWMAAKERVSKTEVRIYDKYQNPVVQAARGTLYLAYGDLSVGFLPENSEKEIAILQFDIIRLSLLFYLTSIRPPLFNPAEIEAIQLVENSLLEKFKKRKELGDKFVKKLVGALSKFCSRNSKYPKTRASSEKKIRKALDIINSIGNESLTEFLESKRFGPGGISRTRTTLILESLKVAENRKD